MKKLAFFVMLLPVSLFAAAQVTPLVVPHKNYTDSISIYKNKPLYNNNPRSPLEDVYSGANGLVIHVRPGETNQLRIESIDPQASLVAVTTLGRVYRFSPDNMPVLMPSMALLEKMPGSSPIYTPAPPSKMPNPLYRPRLKSDVEIK
jgi:hypothetical protein